MKIFGLVSFFLFINIIILAQGISDIIQPIKISASRIDTLLISDLFYSSNYNLKFEENKNVGVLYEPSDLKLIIKAKPNFEGMTLVKFKLNGTLYSIPVLTEAKSELIKHKFIYKPKNTVTKVSITGSFNGWNKDRNVMTYNDITGMYETVIPLEPATYVYKINVDGIDLLDPANPETTPTGFETYNSVLRIVESYAEKNYLHIGGLKEKNNKISLSFIYEREKQEEKLSIKNIIPLLNNEFIPENKLQLRGNTITITLNKEELAGENYIRMAVTQKGKTTNIQQVILIDGIPAGVLKDCSNWYNASFYSIMVDRFNDGDKSNSIPVLHDSLFNQANYQGGDFQGIINKIDEGYFDTLGINVLWISPVYDNPNVAYREYPPPHRWYSGYHGYWPISETAVEEKFGTMEKLKELVAKAHKHKIKVVLDIVAHHVHIDNPIYKEHPGWFGTLNLPDGRKNLRLWDEYRLTTWFEPYMPSFDYTKSKEPIEFMAENCIWWLNETSADGFRHDAVKHVPNEFWRYLTRSLKEKIELPKKTKVYQIGETFGDNNLVGSYVNNGQLSAQFNFNLSYSAIPIFVEKEQSFTTLDYHLNKTFKSFGVNNLMGNIMDSHDKIRFMAYADEDIGKQGVDTREMAWNNPPTVDNPSSYKKAELFYAFMFTIPGLPFIYYGSEFGMTGADDPDNRRMMRFNKDLSQNELEMLLETSKIVKMRNSHSALKYGDFQTVVIEKDIYAYMRCDMNEKLIIILNKCEENKNVKIKLPEIEKYSTAIDLIDGSNSKILKNELSVKLNAIEWKVFKLIK
jgi:glycosidase